jgi:hypothetical protein
VSGQLHASAALPRYPLDRRLGGPQSRSGRPGEQKILDPTGTRTPTPRSSSPLPVAITTILSRLLVGRGFTIHSIEQNFVSVNHENYTLHEPNSKQANFPGNCSSHRKKSVNYIKYSFRSYKFKLETFFDMENQNGVQVSTFVWWWTVLSNRGIWSRCNHSIP